MTDMSTSSWEGDWVALESWVQSLFPTGLPGVALPWPEEVAILLGPRAELAAEAGNAELGDREPADFADYVMERIQEVLDGRPESSSMATITLRPVYSEDSDASESLVNATISRAMTRKREVAKVMKPIASLKDALLDRAPTTPTYGGSGPVGARLDDGPPLPTMQRGEDPYVPHQARGGALVDHTVLRILSMYEAQVEAERGRTARLVEHVVNHLSITVQNAGKDAERYAMEAGEMRRVYGVTERNLWETTKERDMLREERDRLRSELDEARERERESEEEAEERTRRLRRKLKEVASTKEQPQAGGDFFQEVVGAAVNAMREEMGKPEQPAQPVAEGHEHPEKRRRRKSPPGAPRDTQTKRQGSGTPPAPSGGSSGGLSGMLSMLGGGANPGQIANVVAQLPAGMMDTIVDELVKNHPDAAVTLGEKLADRSEQLIAEEEAKLPRRRAPDADDGDENEEDDDDLDDLDEDEDEDEDEGDEDYLDGDDEDGDDYDDDDGEE